MANTRAKPADTPAEQLTVTDGRLPDWYWVDNRVNTNYAPLVKASGIAVYTALVLLSRGYPEFHASSTTIASMAGLDSREAVMAALQRLEDNGLIAVFRKDGRASSYRILNVGVPDSTIPRAFRPSDRPRPVGKTDRLGPDLSEKPAGEPVGKTSRLGPDLSEKPAGLSTTCRKNQQDLSEKPTLHRIDTHHHHSDTSTIHNDDDARPGTRRARFATWDELREHYGEDGVAMAQRLASNQAKRDDLGYIAGVCARRAAQGSPRPAAGVRLAPEVAAAAFQARPAAAPAVLRGDPAWGRVVKGLDMSCGGDSRLSSSSFAEIVDDVLTVTVSGLAPEIVAGRVAWLQSRLAGRIAEEWGHVTGARPAAVVVKGE